MLAASELAAKGKFKEKVVIAGVSYNLLEIINKP